MAPEENPMKEDGDGHIGRNRHVGRHRGGFQRRRNGDVHGFDGYGHSRRLDGEHDVAVMDDMMVNMTGAYTGSTTCRGPFDHGRMTMRRQ
jgi:hypothetical protein